MVFATLYSYDGSSPRRWGCFQSQSCGRGNTMVFPTQVGVFLSSSPVRNSWSSLPHAGGGVSFPIADRSSEAESSPRRWGCFWIYLSICRRDQVFPTQVGVFP